MNKVLFGLCFIAIILALTGPKTPAQNPPPAPAEATEDEALETFEPTERLTADSAVSFPVDI